VCRPGSWRVARRRCCRQGGISRRARAWPRCHTIGLVVRIHRVSLRARRELALAVDRHQPDMVGAERVQHEKRAARGTIGQRFGGAAPSGHGVPRRLDVQQRELAVLAYTEAGDRIVSAIGGKQEPSIRREDDAARALVVVRPGDLVDRPEIPGTGAARRDAFHLGDRTVRGPKIVDDGVLGLVRLHVEMPAMPRVTVRVLYRNGLFIRHAYLSHIPFRWVTWFLPRLRLGASSPGQTK
jgi:hypothetical protein